MGGAAESVGAEFVALDDAEPRLPADALARRRRLAGRVVFGAVALTEFAWFVVLILAARAFIFS